MTGHAGLKDQPQITSSLRGAKRRGNPEREKSIPLGIK
jgi:hypothetical protein